MDPFYLTGYAQEEILTFFAVLVRYSVLISVLPITGDRSIPMQVKILLSLSISLALFPALVSRGQINPADALRWGASMGSLVATILSEVLLGLVMGYVAQLLFSSISFGANMVGTYMGFSAASSFDAHQESQSQIVAQIQTTLAMLAFLAVNGHHLMLTAALDSYRVVGLGQAWVTAASSQRLIEFSGQIIRFGVQISAPVALAIFGINIAFGVVSKAIPQLNVLVLSFAVTSMVGLLVMFLGTADFQAASNLILGRMQDWMEAAALSMKASGR